MRSYAVQVFDPNTETWVPQTTLQPLYKCIVKPDLYHLSPKQVGVLVNLRDAESDALCAAQTLAVAFHRERRFANKNRVRIKETIKLDGGKEESVIWDSGT